MGKAMYKHRRVIYFIGNYNVKNANKITIDIANNDTERIIRNM